LHLIIQDLIFEKVYKEDLSQHLKIFIDNEPEDLFDFIDSKSLTLDTIIMSYFRLNVRNNNKHAVDFYIKSFKNIF
jgi:hypothetical protein